MSLLDILIYPDAQLRRVAEAVENVDGELVSLLDQMLETMYHAPGIGLAATQVNVHRRFFVMDVSEEGNEPMVFINPEILLAEGEIEHQEGCLSIPGIFENIKRPAQIRVAAIDREGKPFEIEVEGLQAVCIQHELDHLNGKLFVDYLSPLKRNRIRKKMLKQMRLDSDS